MLRGWFLALSACGRLGFEPAGQVGDAAADATGDASGDTVIDSPAGSVTLTFGDRPEALIKDVSEDTYISDEAGESGFNFGSDDEVRIEADGQERALFAFAIAAIPTTATVLSAKLTVVATQLPLVPGAIRIHPLTESWEEGTSAGGAGIANWTFRQPLIPWSLPGASPPASASASVAMFTPTALGPVTFTIPTATVQSWVSAPTTNFGILLISTSTESSRFTTREGPASDRPLLTITYQP